MEELKRLADALIERAKQANLGIVTAESCTAGLLCQVLADAEGASLFFHGGFVTYTKPHKSRALGVPEALLREKGAVCAEVARAMAEGALKHSNAGISRGDHRRRLVRSPTRTEIRSGAFALRLRAAASRRAIPRAELSGRWPRCDPRARGSRRLEGDEAGARRRPRQRHEGNVRPRSGCGGSLGKRRTSGTGTRAGPRRRRSRDIRR